MKHFLLEDRYGNRKRVNEFELLKAVNVDRTHRQSFATETVLVAKENIHGQYTF